MDNTLNSLFPSTEPKLSPPPSAAKAAPAEGLTSRGAPPSNGFMRELERANATTEAPSNAPQESLASPSASPKSDAAPIGAVPMSSELFADALANGSLAPGMPASGFQLDAAAIKTTQDIKSLLKNLDPKALAMNPALSLMTGRLERLDPVAIPAIVAKTPFLQEAVASENISRFMDVPAMLGDVLAGLGISPDQIQNLPPDAMERVVTINQVLKALGLDAQRVRDELTQLQDTLTSDGVAPYVTRAAALRAKERNETKRGKTSSADSPRDTDSQPLPQPAARDNAGKRDNAMAALLASGVAGQQAIAPQNGRPAAASMPLPVSAPTNSGAPTRGESSSSLLPTDRGSATIIPEGMTLEQNPTVFSQTLPANVQTSTPSAPTNVTPDVSPARARTASTDPFLSMDQRLREASSVVTTPFNNDAPKTNNLAAPPAPATVEILREDVIRQNASPAAVSSQPAPVEPKSRVEVEPSSEDSLPQMIGNTPISRETRLPKNPSPAPVAAVSDRGERRESGISRGEERREEKQKTRDASRPQDASQVMTTDFKGQINEAAEATNMTSHTHQEAVHRVFQKAEMMVSDGGGSMRFDMPTPWGKVDLAVQVDGNNVQIKLMTESAQARDALQADLSRLRDNLASQNLRLHQVDFGLLNGQSLTQQFDQRNFDSRNFREEILDFRTDALRNAQRATTTATRAIDRVSGVTQIGHANGHIQVRV